MLYTPNVKSFSDLLKKKGWSPTLIANHGWKFAYVFTKVLKKVMRRGDNEFRRYHLAPWDAVLKNSKVGGERVRFSTLVVNYLEDWDVLICRRDYITPKQVPGTTVCTTKVFLKLNDGAMVEGFSRWTAPATWKAAPLAAKEATAAPLTGIYQRLAAQLHRVTIDATEARRLTAEALRTGMALRDKKYRNRPSAANPSGEGYSLKTNRRVDAVVASYWGAWVDGVEAGELHPVADESGTGRLYTALSSSPTHLRPTLLVDGLPVFEFDIANSQPLIFCTLLKAHFSTSLPPKVAEFIDLCEKGLFYSTIRSLVLSPDEDAVISDKDFKTAFFGKIFYSTEKRNWMWRQKFEDRYPEVSRYITSLKESSHKDLPAELSRRESRIMLDGVCAKLLDAGASFYPLHDAVYAAKKDFALVERVIREEFAAAGVNVKINIKLPKPLPLAAPVPILPASAPTVEQMLAQFEANFAATEAALEASETYKLLEGGVRFENTSSAQAELSLDAFFAE